MDQQVVKLSANMLTNIPTDFEMAIRLHEKTKNMADEKKVTVSEVARDMETKTLPDWMKAHQEATMKLNEHGRPEYPIRGFAAEGSIRPAHYGGEADPYEPRKVIKAWNLGFNLGNVLKYIRRAGKKDPRKLIEDLEKAKQYIEFEIQELKNELVLAEME